VKEGDWDNQERDEEINWRLNGKKKKKLAIHVTGRGGR
jgi:hypothetical protein